MDRNFLLENTLVSSPLAGFRPDLADKQRILSETGDEISEMRPKGLV